MKPRLRPQRGDPEQPRRAHSIYNVSRAEWIYISVPAIVTPALFDMVQEQLEQNRKHNRQSRRGARYLPQGLLVCKAWSYAYYGKPVSLSAGKDRRRAYAYYRCIGSDAYRFGGQRICHNKQVRTDLLGEAVWQDVCSLLREPEHITQEHQRRLSRSSNDRSLDNLRALMQKVKRGISRLTDAYQDGLIERTEFEPRLRYSKERLHHLDEQIATL